MKIGVLTSTSWSFCLHKSGQVKTYENLDSEFIHFPVIYRSSVKQTHSFYGQIKFYSTSNLSLSALWTHERKYLLQAAVVENTLSSRLLPDSQPSLTSNGVHRVQDRVHMGSAVLRGGKPWLPSKSAPTTLGGLFSFSASGMKLELSYGVSRTLPSSVWH